MYLQLPNFEGFANIAICPQKSSSSALCYLFKTSGNPSFAMEEDVTYLPLFAGHLYIMYDSYCQSERKVNYFQSEEAMKEYLHTQLRTPVVYPYLVNANLGKWWVPHLTPAISFNKESFQQANENLDKLMGLKLRGGSPPTLPKKVLIDNAKWQQLSDEGRHLWHQFPDDTKAAILGSPPALWIAPLRISLSVLRPRGIFRPVTCRVLSFKPS